MKKILCVVLALVMIMGLATTAFAAEAESNTFTISLVGNEATPTAGHTFTVYQIFTGKVHEGVLSDVKYGANYTPGDAKVGDPVPQADLDAIVDARAFADSLVDGNKLEGTYNTLSEANGWTLENVPAGYYLIVDTTETLPEGHTRSAYIVEVVEDVNIAPKNSTTTFSKKVKDTNDSTDTTGIDDNDWQDSADHDIGDEVPYQINASFADLSQYETYEVEFEDVMSPGLDFNNDLTISMTYTYKDADGNLQTETVDVTSAFTKTVTDPYQTSEEKYNGGTYISLKCEDIKALVEEDMLSASFTIDYTCDLNADAFTGEPGNPNKARVRFDREPDGEGKGETSWDVCIVFTFTTTVNKVDPELKPLTGAEFALAKFVANENGTETYKGVKGDWETLELVKNDEGTTFSFKGLDDGYYRITETKAPAGYNSIDPIYFTVTAEHQVEAEDPQLTNLQAEVVKADGTSYTEEELLSGNIAKFTVTKNDGKLSTDIINRSGTELPETGGIGTTIFYILGAALALGAVVVLVTRRRMTSEG